jgi:TRAP-type transport system periplasmic protein
MRTTAAAAIALLAGVAAGAPPVAAELPEMTVNAIGLNSRTVASTVDEVPFWNERIPEASDGRITAEFTPVDLSGVRDEQVMRMTTLGVVTFTSGDISKMAGDDPVFEGCDLAGLTLDIETARAACDAWAPTMSRVMEEKFNIKLLGTGTNPPQVFWCREPISGLDDLAGKKIRVFNQTMNDFIGAVGGTTVSMPFAEVVPALQRGVVDCGVTGTLSGNTAGWPEVSTHLYPMYLGWSINYQSVNLDAWNSWPEEVQAFFTEQFEALEDQMWATGAKAVADAENCNFGKDPCEMGTKVDMTLVEITEEDRERHKELMESVVLAEWGKRCGRDCAEEWNQTVGPVVGLEIPLDQL